MRTLAYGAHPEQVMDLYVPAGDGPFPTILLVHGGCFRAGYRRDLNAALAADLAGSGFAALNVEYRRLGAGGGWPEMLEDVLAAFAAISTVAAPIRLDRVALAGHSAGGYLALMAAGLLEPGALRGVVAQAPLTDLPAALRDGVCQGSVEVLLAAGAPSPIDAPPNVPQLLVHGDADEHVVVEQSRSYARASGARYVELPGCGHMAHLDPKHEAWRIASHWLADILA